MQLRTAEVGKELKISGLQGSERYRLRLMELGFFPGTLLRVIRKNDAAIYLRVGSSRLILDHTMAECVIVW